MDDNEKELENKLIEGQITIGEEKSKAIAHKDSSLQRLDESFNKHIEAQELKKSDLLAYWIKDFSEYHDNEKIFKLTTLKTLKTFKRGDIIKVNLGFNIGDELGGLHYCVVLNKKDNPYSGTLNVIPLSSFKPDKKYNKTTCIDLGDELFILLNKKYDTENQILKEEFNSLQIHDLYNDENKLKTQNLLKKINSLQKISEEISRMKHGSIAYVNQITTISKQRIFKTPILSGIKISSNTLDLIDQKLIELYTK